MKRIIFYILIFVAAVMAACDKGDSILDQEKTSDLNEETTFVDSALTMQFLTRIYTDIGFSADPKRFGASVGVYTICDEAENSAQSATSYNIILQTGAVSAINIPADAWNKSYANIRRVNVFLSHLPNTPLSSALKDRVQGEARFLRAWYYFILLKHYGGVPLIGDVVYTPTDVIGGKRNTFEECVNYISSECEAAASLLPPQQLGLDFGRITKGACLALKSRLLLYAASPLFNGRAERDGILGYPTADEDRWSKAAQAALEVIKLGIYNLVEINTPPGYGFQKVFTLRKNSEYILQEMAGNNRTLEAIWNPPTRTGSGSAMPYQELVDAFGTIEGKPITDPASVYDPNNPYANRDPRLAYTILFNQGVMLNTSKTFTPVNTYFEAPQDGFPITKTGYYLRKFLDENTIASGTSAQTERCFPLIRYAEILLNYAEASNEANDISTAYTQIEAVRKRAGINIGDGHYGLKENMTKEEMRAVIQNERRVELAIEEHRYWDIRRWKIAEDIANKTLHGMKITKTGNNFSYELVDIRTPVFDSDKWYLWPIPQSEVNKSKELVQNPGW